MPQPAHWGDNGRVNEPLATPTGRQVGADIVLAVAATAVSLAAVAVAAKPAGQLAIPVVSARISWGVVVPVVIARTAPLAIRRFRPLTAFWLCVAVCMLVTFPEPLRRSAAATVADLIALVPVGYSAIVHSRYRAAALASTPAAILVPISVVRSVMNNYTLLVTLLVFIAVLVVANSARLSRRRATESQARLLRVQKEQEDATHRAIGQERARIASELHDVVTHNVSMMVVQAGAARRVLDAEPDEARAALLAIEESGRAAIVELQHMLGLLAPAEDTGSLCPQPGLNQLRPLIDRVTAPVELQVRGAPRALPPGVDLAAYLVVQEALTNVVKHAGKAPATVTLDYRPGALVIEVADSGGTPAGDCAPSGGRGLLGLRERVQLYGGELEVGRQPGGGWRVRAQFPAHPATTAIPVSS